MTKQELKNEIKKTAKEINCTEIEIITAMQSECAKQKNEEMLEVLCEIKSDYITI